MQHVERSTQVKTKIVATVGPASESAEMLRQLAEAGVDVFRLNLAHGTPEDHAAVMERIRTVSRDLHRPLAVLADLPGPKIRLGEVPGGEMECESGKRIIITREADPTDERTLSTSHPELVDALEPDDRLLLADGTVGLRVVEKKPEAAVCEVEMSGTVRSRQGVHAPGVHLKLPAFTDDDRALAAWAARAEVDFVGLSFVAGPVDVEDLRAHLAEHGSTAHVVAKIERAEALEHLEEIVETADAVMVARGDLGVEIDVARVPGVQKEIIEMCRRRRVPVITATQMLESMCASNRPTRAEATDVANAVLDGTDAVMLSAETAIGRYPVEAVATMSRIAREAERFLRAHPPVPAARDPSAGRGVKPVTEAVVHGAVRVADILDAELVIVATHSGQTALALSKQRHFAPTVASSDEEGTLRRLCLYWGVIPLPGAQQQGSEPLLRYVVEWGRGEGILQSGARVVLLASTDWTPEGHNMLLVHEVP